MSRFNISLRILNLEVDKKKVWIRKHQGELAEHRRRIAQLEEELTLEGMSLQKLENSIKLNYGPDALEEK